MNNSLPSHHVAQKDLIQGLGQQEDLITTSVQLLDKQALSEFLGLLGHLGEVEDLLLALLLVFKVLQSNINVPINLCNLTI